VTVWLAFALGSVTHPSSLAGQTPPSLDESVWGDNEPTYYLLNSLLSGVGAGLVRAVGGGSFAEGFFVGALGGSVGYVGKKIAAKGFDGAGFLGRQIGAMGASMTRNGASGEAFFSHLLFPIGPLYVHLDRSGEQARWWAKVDAPALLTAGYLALHPDATVDWGSTLSSGAFVFRSGRGWFLGQEAGVVGQTAAGTIILDEADGRDLDRTLRHERVHILQADFAFHTLGDPLESWLLDKGAITRRVHRVFDFNLLIPVGATALMRGLGLAYVDRPTEAEALFMSGR